MGERNLGDDIIFQAQQMAFAGVPLAVLPRTVHHRFSSYTRHLQFSKPRAILLGGGTLVGRRECAEPLEAFASLWPEATPIMLGIGVEDPSFVGRRVYTSRDELSRWKPLLQRFDRITVRGPRSRELLNGIGVDATVVGDPALMFCPQEVLAPGDSVGINVSEPEDAWGGSLREARLEFLAALRDITRTQDVRFTFVVYNPKDHPITSWFVNELGSCASLTVPRDGNEAQRVVADCQLFVGERLHSLVMAASAGVPTVALEYRPKCYDFQASIGLEAFSIRTDRLHRDVVVETVREILSNRSHLATGVERRVAELRQRLSLAHERNRLVVQALT